MTRPVKIILVGMLPICFGACAQQAVTPNAKAAADSVTPPVRIIQTRDEQVMDSVLKHFLTHHAEDEWTVGRSAGLVLLHLRNPGKTGILDQTSGDIGKHKLDPNLLKALLKRNRGNGWNSIPFSFEKFLLDPRVHVLDLDRERRSWGRFEVSLMDHKYKGYFEAFAPGFSKDGTKAVVRAWVGPSAHGATVTYALELRKDKWSVLWREFAFYV